MRKRRKTTHDASIHPELHLARLGGRDQGCETFEIAAQHPRGDYGVFHGETALTISRQSQSDEVLTRERPQQPSS
jgi:hypothetical protein